MYQQCDYSEQVNEPAGRVQHFCPILGEKVSPNCYSSLYSLCEIPDLVESDDEEKAIAVPDYENDLIVVSRKFQHVFSEKLRKPIREFAGMAKPLETGKVYDLSRENGLLTVDSGATSTLTRSLFNMTEVTPKVIKIHLAGEGSRPTSDTRGITLQMLPERFVQSRQRQYTFLSLNKTFLEAWHS
jgi:hypothetical protein